MSEGEWAGYEELFWEPCTFISDAPATYSPEDMDGLGVIQYRVRGFIIP
jgi:hypothetical protein